MRADRLRLLDAIEQVELILRFSAAGKQAFLDDMVLQSAILHRLALLGEACRGLSPGLREAHPSVPWAQMIAFRNVLLHEYFGVDLELVWTIVTGHVAALGASLKAALSGLPD